MDDNASEADEGGTIQDLLLSPDEDGLVAVKVPGNITEQS